MVEYFGAPRRLGALGLATAGGWAGWLRMIKALAVAGCLQGAGLTTKS